MDQLKLLDAGKFVLACDLLGKKVLLNYKEASWQIMGKFSRAARGYYLSKRLRRQQRP
jgi:hypothetical protein